MYEILQMLIKVTSSDGLKSEIRKLKNALIHVVDSHKKSNPN